MNRLLAVTGIAGSVLWAASANADPLISIGLGAAPVTVATNGGVGSVSFAGASPPFTIEAVDAHGNTDLGLSTFPLILASSTLDIDVTGPGTLYIWVTSQFNPQGGSPSGMATLISGFDGPGTDLTGDVTVKQQTFVDNTNTAYGTMQAISPVESFNSSTVAAGAIVASAAMLGAGPYSVTEEYILTSTGTGTAQLSMQVDGVPGPTAGAGLPGLILAGGFLFAWRRSRRTNRDASALPIA